MNLFLHYSLYMLIFLSALQVVIKQHEVRELFAELEVLEKKYDEINEVWRNLQIEQSTLATHDRIELFAKTQLDMKIPDHSSILLLKK